MSTPFPNAFLTPDLVNASVSVVFELSPDLASKPIEEIHAKGNIVARFLSCPSCAGSGKMVFRDGLTSIRVAVCPICAGKGTIHAAVTELRNQVLVLETHAAGLTRKGQAVIKELTTVNQSSTIPEVKELALRIAGLLAGTTPPTPTQSNEQPNPVPFSSSVNDWN